MRRGGACRCRKGLPFERLDDGIPRPSSGRTASGMTTRRKKIYVSLAVVAAVLLIAAAAAGPIMSSVEQPDYKVTMSDGAIEIRSYGPMIAAEAEVKGERKAAINEGFRLIAAYIFGANKPNAKIAMTAPVQQQGAQKIAMTAPGHAAERWR